MSAVDDVGALSLHSPLLALPVGCRLFSPLLSLEGVMSSPLPITPLLRKSRRDGSKKRKASDPVIAERDCQSTEEDKLVDDTSSAYILKHCRRCTWNLPPLEALTLLLSVFVTHPLGEAFIR